MLTHLQRSLSEPIRKGLDFDQRWHGDDEGLIYCWERGRELREERPVLSEQADRGELMVLSWEGGVERKLKGRKTGTLQYLATLQGLRGEDLSIDSEGRTILTCAKTGQAVTYFRTR